MSYSRDGRPASTRISKIRELPERMLPPEKVFQEKWPLDFVEAMKNRVKVGTYRYSNGASQFESRESAESFLRRLQEKLDTFNTTRNHEMLVDIAVYAMLVWQFDNNPRAHYTPLDQGID